ncbi:DNA translocase FtsK [bacterium]|nr:DNA translocase FtsK [bacterium]MBU1984724.1 DNA translocase FtsK [bacterium]
MAPRSGNQRSTRRKSSSSASFWWGFALLTVAGLLFLSLVSYSARDSDGLPELFDGRSGVAADNWIGKPGALIAYALGTLLFGRWAALGIPLIVGIWGWTLLRRLLWQRAFVLMAVTLSASVWLSSAIGLLGALGAVDHAALFHHEGNFGWQASLWLVGFLNGIGAVLVMLLILIGGLALSVAGFAGLFERKVHTAIDRASRLKTPRVPATWFLWRRWGEEEQREEIETSLDTDPESGNGHTTAELQNLSKSRAARKTPLARSQLAIQIEDRSGYVFPPIDLFNPPRSDDESGMSPEEQQRNSVLLEKTLATFGVQAKVVHVNPGPVITRFDLEPAPGVKVSRIESLADDIALALRARGLRILAPIPGVAAVGVEIANIKPATVTFREVAESPNYQSSASKLTVALGRTVSGEIFVCDLAALPHLLIAGTTGSGKSVCVNTIIASILLRATPQDVQLVLIDPKKLELSAYNELRNHHVTHRPDLSEYVVTRPDEAVKVLRSCLVEMERRYDLLAERGTRNLAEYNEAVRQDAGEGDEKPLPYIVVVVDELADLMVTAQREVEEPIARLAQLARAVGIHLVVATQRPSVDVITGVIKANFPARIAFRVAMKVDSRTILDTNGAEMLLGQGDMLFQHPEEPAATRVQGALLTGPEISRLISHICRQSAPRDKLTLPVEAEEAGDAGTPALDVDSRDPLFMEAAKIVVRTGQGSVSILQRRLKIGYSRAARLIDQLERAGVVGPFDGSRARAVLVDEHYFDIHDEQ